MNYKNILIILLSLFFTSCSTKIKDFSTFKKEPILKSNFINKKDLETQEISIVVLNFNDRKNQISIKSNLSNSLAVKTENILATSKLVTLRDRKAFKKLAKEISLAELNQSGSYSGPKQVDYAISGDIETAGFSHEYVAASSYMDLANKKYIYTPARNKYVSNVSGNVKIYKIPSLEVVNIISFNDIEYRSEDADKYNIITLDKNLVRKAGLNAINKQAYKLKNFFSAKQKAFILEKRVKKKKNIFKISLGKLSGLKEGQKVNIFTKRKEKNELTGDSYIEEVNLGKGVISNLVRNNTAWIIVKDNNIAEQVRLGDYVTVEFSKSFYNLLL